MNIIMIRSHSKSNWNLVMTRESCHSQYHTIFQCVDRIDNHSDTDSDTHSHTDSDTHSHTDSDTRSRTIVVNDASERLILIVT